MKRLHVHIKTKDLDRSVGFYSALFGKRPDRLEKDYAKWLVDDPRANVSVSTRSAGEGVDHLGVSIETRDELDEIAGRLRAENVELLEEPETACCYAKSNKFWTRDPQGAVWELFQTFGDSATYGASPVREAVLAAQAQPVAACCAPDACGETC